MTIDRLSIRHCSGDTVNVKNLLAFDEILSQEVENSVRCIIQQVRTQGDDALVNYTNQFDNRDVKSVSQLIVSSEEIQEAKQRIDTDVLQALELSAKRIRNYHQHQLVRSWQFEDEYGSTLGQKVSPIQRVGVYVPGGTASYPSTVLMNVLPAKVAGVKDITMVSPVSNNQLNDNVLVAASIAGVNQVISVGGAQAIAALAYGTQTINTVDKIVGPGNIYVATAKKQVFGTVGIDMIAGPSELTVYADSGIDPMSIAKDLCSQAEHDVNAQSILIACEQSVIDNVNQCIEQLVPQLPRASIVTRAFNQRSALIKVNNDEQALHLINQIAPEHLQLSVSNAQMLVEFVHNAGAIFVGYHSSEAHGDYCAGPSHVLPTSATAKFASPLGVYDFLKRSSIIQCSQQGGNELSGIAATLARAEGLEAHALSAESRK